MAILALGLVGGGVAAGWFFKPAAKTTTSTKTIETTPTTETFTDDILQYNYTDDGSVVDNAFRGYELSLTVPTAWHMLRFPTWLDLGILKDQDNVSYVMSPSEYGAITPRLADNQLNIHSIHAWLKSNTHCQDLGCDGGLYDFMTKTERQAYYKFLTSFDEERALTAKEKSQISHHGINAGLVGGVVPLAGSIVTNDGKLTGIYYVAQYAQDFSYSAPSVYVVLAGKLDGYETLVFGQFAAHDQASVDIAELRNQSYDDDKSDQEVVELMKQPITDAIASYKKGDLDDVLMDVVDEVVDAIHSLKLTLVKDPPHGFGDNTID